MALPENINSLIQLGIGSGVGSVLLFAGQRLIVGLLDYNQAKKAPERFMLEKGHQGGTLVYKNAIKRLTNPETRARSINFFDKLGNYADKGWDAGLRGLPLPKI